MANDIEQIEYAGASSGKRIDLDIEDVQYTPVTDKDKIKLAGKVEVPTERGKQVAGVSKHVAEAGKQGKSAVSNFMAWNRERKAKTTAPQVQAPAAPPKKKIAYINGKPVIVDAKESAPRAPRAPSARPYAASYQQPAYSPQPQRTTPDIAGGMHTLPNIAGQHGIANTPRIISTNTSNLPKIVGAQRSGAGFMASIGSGGSTMEKLGHSGGAGNSFEKLAHVGTTGASLGKLQLKGKGRFF